jgi:hypothetical protein
MERRRVMLVGNDQRGNSKEKERKERGKTETRETDRDRQRERETGVEISIVQTSGVETKLESFGGDYRMVNSWDLI